MVGLVGQLSIADKTEQGEKDSKMSFKFFEKSCDFRMKLPMGEMYMITVRMVLKEMSQVRNQV